MPQPLQTANKPGGSSSDGGRRARRPIGQHAAVTERRGGGRYRKFRARILTRDPWCTEPACRNRTDELHHDRPLALGAVSSTPDDARGVCRDCHKRLTGELRDELGLPFAPNGRTAGPVKPGPITVWEGAISIPIKGPAIVIDRDGVVRRIRRGEYGWTPGVTLGWWANASLRRATVGSTFFPWMRSCRRGSSGRGISGWGSPRTTTDTDRDRR
jgi:hypothetical protein